MGKRDSLIILTHKKAGELNCSPALNLNNEAGIRIGTKATRTHLLR